MRRRRKIDAVSGIATAVGCLGALFQFTVGAFVLGDQHPVTIAVAVIALAAMATAMITGGMINGR